MNGKVHKIISKAQIVRYANEAIGGGTIGGLLLLLRGLFTSSDRVSVVGIIIGLVLGVAGIRLSDDGETQTRWFRYGAFGLGGLFIATSLPAIRLFGRFILLLLACLTLFWAIVSAFRYLSSRRD